MSDAQLAMLLEQSKGNPPPQNGDIQALRDWFEGLNAVFPMAPETQVQRVNLGPCSVDLLSSPDSDPGKLDAMREALLSLALHVVEVEGLGLEVEGLGIHEPAPMHRRRSMTVPL